MRPRTVRAVVATTTIAVLLLSTAGCVSPALNVDHYRQQASESITASQSELQTTGIVLESMLADRIFESTADEVVSASESALSSVVASFGAVQPPAASGGVERSTMRYLGAAEDAVRQARIAVRRSDVTAMRLALERVKRVLDRANAISEQLR